MIDRLEALADALMKLNGWDDPSSQAYRNRNPLLLKAYSLSRAQMQDERGVRIFTSLLGGYRAGLNDLFEKCGGRSRAKLMTGAPLRDLLSVYTGFSNTTIERRAVLFLQRALRLDANEVHAGTPLEWFLQTNAGKAVTGDRSPVTGETAGEEHAEY